MLWKKLNYKPKPIKCWLFTPARIFLTLIKDRPIMSWSLGSSTPSWIREWHLEAVLGGCKGQSLACATAGHSLAQGTDKSRGTAGTGQLGREREKKMETVFKVSSIFQANTKWRSEVNSVCFILNKMGIIFEGSRKILAFLLVVWNYEMLTSVLLQRYFRSRVSRFRLNQYITKGGLKQRFMALLNNSRISKMYKWNTHKKTSFIMP